MKKIRNLSKRVSQAIAHYWLTRHKQSQKQSTSGRSDQGARSAVTGGTQMDGFITLITELIVEAGADESNIFHNKENHYNVAAFLVSDKAGGIKGRYAEPADDLTFEIFAKSLVAQVTGFGVFKKR
jgi:hypothetical protein